MSTTLTIRTDDELRQAIEDRARAQGKTVSTLVREILERALIDRPMHQRTGHLKGRLTLPQRSDGWRETLRRHNWRP